MGENGGETGGMGCYLVEIHDLDLDIGTLEGNHGARGPANVAGSDAAHPQLPLLL